MSTDSGPDEEMLWLDISASGSFPSCRLLHHFELTGLLTDKRYKVMTTWIQNAEVVVGTFELSRNKTPRTAEVQHAIRSRPLLAMSRLLLMQSNGPYDEPIAPYIAQWQHPRREKGSLMLTDNLRVCFVGVAILALAVLTPQACLSIVPRRHFGEGSPSVAPATLAASVASVAPVTPVTPIFADDHLLEGNRTSVMYWNASDIPLIAPVIADEHLSENGSLLAISVLGDRHLPKNASRSVENPSRSGNNSESGVLILKSIIDELEDSILHPYDGINSCQEQYELVNSVLDPQGADIATLEYPFQTTGYTALAGKATKNVEALRDLTMKAKK